MFVYMIRLSCHAVNIVLLKKKEIRLLPRVIPRIPVDPLFLIFRVSFSFFSRLRSILFSNSLRRILCVNK